MASTNRAVLQFVVEAAQAQQEINRIISSLGAVQKELVSLSKGGAVAGLQGLVGQYGNVTASIDRTKKAIEELTAAQARAAQNVSGRAALGPGAGGAFVQQGRGITDTAAQDTSSRVVPTQQQLAQAIQLATQEGQRLNEILQQQAAEFNALAAQAPGAYQQILAAQRQVTETERQLQAILSGDVVADALRVRQTELRKNIDLLTKQKVAIEESVRARTDRRFQGRLEGGLEQVRTQNTLLSQAAAKERELLEIEKELQATRGQQVGKLFDVKDLQSIERLNQVLAKIGQPQVGSSKAFQADLQKIQTLIRERIDLLRRAEVAGRKAETAMGQDQQLQSWNRVSEEINEVNAALAIAEQQLIETFDPAKIEQVFPGLIKEIGLVNQLTKEIQEEGQAQSVVIQKTKEREAALRRIAEIQRKGGTGIQQAVDPGRVESAVQRTSGGLDRLLLGVFGDFKRRFTATLQFAISGALIFGVQQFLREFLQAAIEVEREFEDIATALEFDIGFERGTVEFNRELESVRVEILALAQDFNVLPTEANEAAFKMVSRFNDVNNAMIALRAQLLATKVSEIDQAEVLRALTAVAEGFASAIYTSNTALSLQEKLLQKESIAAQLYNRALDGAVAIQQQFGVEVEDTLEGTARATQVFRQLGFSLSETSAIVASVSRELGQTGAQAAERLNRSLGQLTEPKIREGLLDLANNSEAFTLQISDFESGATAWGKIADQFERVEAVDPAAAREILNIIGQRRELEAVAAALGTGDVQKAMEDVFDDSAGAAAERFGFLEATTSEILKSISANVLELAQNFERLGGLTPLKVLLKALDGVLGAVNSILKLVIDLKNAFDSWLGIPFSGIALGILNIAAAIKLALVLGRSLVSVFTVLKGTAGGLKVAALLTSLRGVGGGGIGVFGQTLAAGGVARGAAGQGARGFAQYAAGTGLAKFSAGLSAAAGPLAVVAVTALGTAAAIKSLQERSEELADSYEDLVTGLAATRKRAAAESAELGETGEAARQRRLQAELEELRGRVATAPTGAPSFGQQVGAGALDVLRGATSPGDFAALLGGESELKDAMADAVRPEFAEGSREYIDRLIKDTSEALSESLINETLQSLRDADLGSFPTPDFSTEGIDFSDAGFWGDQANAIAQGLDIGPEAVRKALIAQGERIKRLRVDPDTNADELAALEADFQTQVTRFFEAYGATELILTETTNSLNAELRKLDTDVQLGLKTSAQAAAERQRIASTFETLAKRYQGIGFKAEAEANRQLAQDAILASQQDLLNAVQEEIDLGSERRSAIDQLDREIALWARLLLARGASPATRLQAAREVARGLYEKAELYKDQAIQEKRNDVALAQNSDQRQIATRELIKVLKEKIRFLRKDGLETDQLEQEVAVLEQQIAQQRYDDAVKTAQANRRLAAPALSASARLEAEIIGIQGIIDNPQSSTADVVEAQARLRETIAGQAQLELRKVVEAQRASVSVRDELTNLNLSLGALRAEQELAARLFGKSSVEYFQLGTSIKQTQAKLEDMALQLETLNRKLGTDLSDPLAQAEVEFIDAARRLEQLDPQFGEIEKAQAQLAKASAELNLEKVRFDSALFDFKFLFETGELGTSAYVTALETLLSQVDTSTRQGKEIFLQIQGVIDGLTDDVSSLQFNIPGAIRLPTLFEIRRAVEADSMGVNYLDNRQIDVRVNVDTVADMGELLEMLTSALPATVNVEAGRTTSGNAGLTSGGLF